MSVGVPFTRTMRRELGPRRTPGGPFALARATLDTALWPEGRLGEAVAALGRTLGAAAPLASPTSDVVRAAQELGLDATAITVDHGRVDELVRRAGPAVLRVEVAGGTAYLAVARAGRRRLEAIAPSGGRVALGVAEVADAVRRPLEREAAAPFEPLLARLGTDPRGRAAALGALVRGRISARTVTAGWLLAIAADAPLAHQLGEARTAGLLAAVGALHALAALAWLASWWLLGRVVFADRPDLLGPWAGVVAAGWPLRAAAAAFGDALTMRVAALLRRRLLVGALATSADELRNVGHGTLTSRLLDAQTVEGVGVRAGLASLTAVTEALVALGLLAALAPLAAAAFALAVALLGAARAAEHRRLESWDRERLQLTIDTVEKMVGHRTRRVQEAPERRHMGERLALAHYLGAAQRSDAAATAAALVPRLWLAGGLGAVALAATQGASPAWLAALAGGAWLGAELLERLDTALGQLAPALPALGRLAPLLAARFAKGPGPAPDAGGPLVELRDVSYGYPGRRGPALRGGELTITAGDRVLIEGPSGGGKSTLAALLAGTRVPDEGRILIAGADAGSLDPRDRARLVAAVPQFHENVIYGGTLKWNLLMGRPWPHRASDEADAEAVCAELGLAELLARMPAGLEQMVGENGWQLSHGEQTRVFLARAFLQGAKLLILDEPFAALDPQSIERCIAALARRTEALLVISHR
jgi:ATP-binding cassette subfamily B protein